MGFATPLGLLALVGVPVVLFLHLYRRRFRERRVAALFLFAPDLLTSHAGRQRTRLLRTASLWLELLAALLLALVLGGFHVMPPADVAHLVVVLDDSASMQAVDGEGQTLVRARDAVRRLIEEAGDDAHVTLITTGPRPEMLAGPRAPAARAKASLGDWQPERPAHEVAPALGLGLDVAGEHARLVYVTDRVEPPVPPRYRRIALGAPVPNAAIVGARRASAGEEDEKVFGDLLAWGASPLETRVHLAALGDGRPDREIAARDVTLVPGRVLHVNWKIPASTLPLEIRLSPDALPIDDVALLLPEPQRVVPVHVALGQDVERALSVSKVLRAVGDVRALPRALGAALVVTEQPGASEAGATEIVIGAAGEARDDWVGPFLFERRRALGGRDADPLLEGISLEGVIWSAGRADPPGLGLVLAGDVVLLSEEQRRRGIRLHLNLDPFRSNLASSPDWPILLSNVVNQVRDTLPGPVAVNVHVGDEIAWRPRLELAHAEGYQLVTPRGGALPARGRRLFTWEAGQVGLYTLEHERRELARYAVRFVDPTESDLMLRGDVDLPAAEKTLEVGARFDAAGLLERRVLALLLLLVLAADWYVLGRRRPS